MMDELLSRNEGLFVGSLSEDEIELFDEACRKGLAVRSYEGAAGLLGLAKVRRLDRNQIGGE